MKTSLALSPPPCSGSDLRLATRRLGHLFDGVLGPSALKATQHSLLTQIAILREPTMKALADALVMDLSALGHTLKPLERDGFVALVRSQSDRRSRHVVLTACGEAKLRETTELWRVAHARFETAFGPRKARKLRKALRLLASDEFGEAFAAATRVRRPS